jgi:hypothetical protein
MICKRVIIPKVLLQDYSKQQQQKKTFLLLLKLETERVKIASNIVDNWITRETIYSISTNFKEM